MADHGQSSAVLTQAPGLVLEIRVEGSDADEAIGSIGELIRNGFGE